MSIRSKFTLLLAILFLPVLSFCTHIIGGELTYKHLGGDQYEVTLRLYRDCGNGNANFPATAQIRAWYNLGANYVPINIPFPGATLVPPVIDSCVINPGVCVEEAIYTQVATLPQVVGGYHIMYELCCRNGSVLNVVNPLTVGAAFYAFLPPDTMYYPPPNTPTIWLEDFTLPDFTTIDNGPTAWSRTVAPTTDWAEVRNNRFEARDTDGEVVWTSEYVDISAYLSGVNLSIDIDKSGNMESTDSINVYYQLNNGPEVLFPFNGSYGGNFGATTAYAYCLVGDSVRMVVKIKNSANNERHYIDNAHIRECSLPDSFIVGNNSAAVFDSFPPIFLCAVDTFVFNHSATDLDGDSLVYSLCDPFDEYSGNVNTPPPFSNGYPVIPIIPWAGGYNANQPLGPPPLSIDPQTGVLTGTPMQLGQYVVGVQVQEWRNDSLINTTRRDFQFNIVNCPELAEAGIDTTTGIISVCNGNMVNFPNETNPDASSYFWDFGDLTSTTDTSYSKYPSYTYPDTGTYTVTLIVNYGTPCADTAYATVYVGWVNAAFTDDNPKCETEIVTFTDNSTTSNNANITNWDWDFGDSNNSTLQNPTHSYTNSGTYTVTLIVTTDIGCIDTATNIITIDPVPIANAGIDDTVCANNPVVHLAGSVINATGGIWSGGTGTYNPNNTTLITDYTPSNAEITAGFVQLILTTTGNGNCQPVTDTIDITITLSPIVDAGPDDTVCANNPDVQLNGTVLNATGGIWSGGTGTYNPNNTTLNAVYTPSNAEILAGYVTLILTSTGNGNCLPESDTIVITIVPGPIVDAGPDDTVCANSPNINLSGSVTGGSTTGIWTGGAGTFNPNNTTLNAIYTPSNGEITAGTVTLILTSTNNGNCLPVMDSLVITITPEPIVDAGPDDTTCANNPNITLNGSVTGGTTTGQWSTSGTGTFSPNDSDLNAVYIPSPADTAAGMVTIVLTSTNNGGCLPVSDTLVLIITPSPWVTAGPDQTICANNLIVPLNGSVAGGSTTGIWSTTGTGTFSPNNTTLNATYNATTADTAAGSIYIILTSTNNGNCLPVSDTLIVTFSPSPWVNAGPDQLICVDSLFAILNGNIGGGSTTGIWSTSGTGTFTPNNTTLNAVYNASTQDSINGQVTLVLTSTNNGNCLPVTDTMVIDILPSGIADAGIDDTVCANNANVSLNGVISGGATEGIWTTSGSGTFTPSDTSLNATYIPSAQDTVNGTVTLYLTTTNSCNIITESVVITLAPAPVVYAGPDQLIC